MYSAKINGEPTTFGTSGLLYRSNKLMYDRATETIWHQFTGEAAFGPLAGSVDRLPFFPSELTTWGEWVDEHPDTTVLSDETGGYPVGYYAPESVASSIYYDYRTSPDTMFPIWQKSDALEAKAVVMGLEIAGEFKAYPVEMLQQERVVNDDLSGTAVVVLGSATSQAARAYHSGGRAFTDAGEEDAAGLPSLLSDSTGATWRVTEAALENEADLADRLERILTHTSFWFGWFAFHPETEVYTPGE